MHHQTGQTSQLEFWLERHRAGDEHAKDEIIARSCDRLRSLAHRMLRGNFTRLARWEETDDVQQAAMIRLHRSLSDIQPESVARFLGLAATQIRRTLLDLTRHHFGVEGQAPWHQTDGEQIQVTNASGSGDEPQSLDDWKTFHEAVEKLPDAERETFSLVWYEGLTQVEVAKLLNVTERTVRRHWASARCLLHESLGGQAPE